MNQKSFSVYIHVLPNKKVYIGITGKAPVKRWSNGKAYRNNKRFTNAIKKYGWDNIKHEVLFSNLTKEDACKKEIELISKYNSNNRKYGYNYSTGGECSAYGVVQTKTSNKKRSSTLKNHPVSEITRKKISDKINEYYKNNPEAKLKTSIALKKYYKENTEALERLRNQAKGRIPWNKGMSITDEQRELCKINSKRKCVIQYDKELNYIKEYESAKEAERITGIHNASIRGCCNGKRKYAGGYIWKEKI